MKTFLFCDSLSEQISNILKVIENTLPELDGACKKILESYKNDLEKLKARMDKIVKDRSSPESKPYRLVLRGSREAYEIGLKAYQKFPGWFTTDDAYKLWLECRQELRKQLDEAIKAKDKEEVTKIGGKLFMYDKAFDWDHQLYEDGLLERIPSLQRFNSYDYRFKRRDLTLNFLKLGTPSRKAEYVEVSTPKVLQSTALKREKPSEIVAYNENMSIDENFILEIHKKAKGPLDFSEIVKGMKSEEKHRTAMIVQDLVKKGVLNFKDGKTWVKE